ncbi:hypothetical protein M5K25_019832 [Dendrobium thyrsiflorum]|uniref:C2H2-type domain-containing protein n=1 Tax=Dendrobium thyrsiflorum TaxID=117978 RepID=A0ABD0UMT4_DENTH
MAYKRSRSGNGGLLFECKTCYKQFPSFQALGGHRTSHMRTRGRSEAMKTERIKKVHSCSFCGLEFRMGQALGGHMTKHRRHEYEDKKDEKKKEAVRLFDLNLPPTHLDQTFFWDVPMYQFF